MHASTLRKVLWWGFFIRAVLIVYSSFHDSYFEVKYTDIDYVVFTEGIAFLDGSRGIAALIDGPAGILAFTTSYAVRSGHLASLDTSLSEATSPKHLSPYVTADAAEKVLQGGSPFDRPEYRYSPIVAYLVLPNHLLHPAFGKWLFAACDMAVAWLTARIVKATGGDPQDEALAASLWLFNPFTATISTRGSMESPFLSVLLGSLLLLLQPTKPARGHARIKWSSLIASGLLFGLAVHWRLYPAIYTLPIVLFLLNNAAATAATARGRSGSSSSTGRRTALSLSLPPLTIDGVAAVAVFGAASAAAFASLGLAFYRAYGQLFLDEYLLYHLKRQDPKHNFSVYFYPMQLAARSGADGLGAALGSLVAGLAFVPQLGSAALLGGLLWRQLPLALLAQTIAFVSLNKVATAQYFVWYMGLAPLCLPAMLRRGGGPVAWAGVRVGPAKRLGAAGLVWVAGELHWLLWAYLLEFRGLPVTMGVWGASVAFLLCNANLLGAVLRERSA